jgi:hypothetical protein
VAKFPFEFVGTLVTECFADESHESDVVGEILGGGALRDFHEEVEVVRHEAVGDDAQSTELFVEAHELEEVVLLRRPE